MTKEREEVQYEDRLAIMLNATQDIQRLLLWCGIQGIMTQGQADQILQNAEFIAKEVARKLGD